MSMPCNPSPGTYAIYASDDTGVNTCPSGVCGEVVVLHNVKADVGLTAQEQMTILKHSTQVILTLDVGEPDCHYQMPGQMWIYQAMHRSKLTWILQGSFRVLGDHIPSRPQWFHVSLSASNARHVLPVAVVPLMCC